MVDRPGKASSRAGQGCLDLQGWMGAAGAAAKVSFELGSFPQ